MLNDVSRMPISKTCTTAAILWLVERGFSRDKFKLGDPFRPRLPLLHIFDHFMS